MQAPFTPSDWLWPPQRLSIEMVIEALSRVDSVCLWGPTGGGKTVVATELMRWAAWQSTPGIFYVNRRLLVPQTSDAFTKAGLMHGIRCAGYDDYYAPELPFQIASADTERSRVLQRKAWEPFSAGLVVVDEAHLQKADTMKAIVADHQARGAKVVLLTATPVGLSHMAQELLVPGRLADYRACKAIVPAVVRTIQQPDMNRVSRNVTGEYVWKGQRRRIYTQTIVGDVIGRWKQYNPDARATLLFAPGVPESVWFTGRFRAIGVNWAHVDANDAILDGIRTKLTRKVWLEIQERFRDGEIKGLSCRFKIREGVDFPFVWHIILATPIGSLASAVQTVGRGMRYSSQTPDNVLVTDHGGVYLTHGSWNHDRPWRLWWNLPERVASTWHRDQIRESKVREPIRCPKCEGERLGGVKCPHCGFIHEKSRRVVIMEDGRMVTRDGGLIRKKYVSMRPNTENLWERMYWGWSKNGVKRTFRQMEGNFCRLYGYFPPRTIPLMPTCESDWHRHVCQVPREKLVKRAS